MTAKTLAQNEIANAIGQEQVAQTAGGQTLQGLNQAGTQIAPINEFGVQIDPTTGQPITSINGSNSFIDIAKMKGSVDAAQQNAQTAGTAEINAANTGYQNAVQDYGNMSATNNAAEAQITQVKNLLSQTGLNQGIPDYTKAVNTLQTKMGSTAYTKLVASITELQNIYSNLLATSGTTPTGSESQALSLLNPNSTAEQINASIGQLQVAAYNRLNAQYGKMQTFQNNLGGGSSTQSSGDASNVTWGNLYNK